MPEADTKELLEMWHAGDRGALDRLLERDLPWIQARVSRRLGAALRARAETGDFVGEAVAEVLAYAPRFLLENRAQFRALLARIAENVIRDQHDRFRALRRALSRERPLPPDTRLELDGARGTVTRPSEAAGEREWEAWVRLGLELIEPDERHLIVLKQWDGLSFAEIAKGLGSSEDAARMRYHRAVARLAGQIQELRAGRVPGAAEIEAEDVSDG
jgi:RNA polymerase sigma-70 factor, ECF subfamily